MHMSTDQLVMEIPIPEGVQVEATPERIMVKGAQGQVERKRINPGIKIEVKGRTVVIAAARNSRRERKVAGTLQAHIKNMMAGVRERYRYSLRVCSGHFPMNVTASKTDFTVRNFLGEKIPRIMKIPEGASVRVDGSEIAVESADKEVAGQTAASIEQLCRITNRDRRIFQDGIWIVRKGEQGSK